MLMQVATQYVRFRFGARFSSREQLLRHQERQIARLLKFVRGASPFYAARPVAVLDDAPVINKSVMMQHFDDINTAGLRAEEALAIAMEAERSRNFAPTVRGFTVGMSSGTSGHRGLFVVSRKEMAMHAAAMLARVFPGSPLAPNRIAFFLRSDSNLYQSLNLGHTKFRFFDLQRPFEDLVAGLHELQPSIVVAPATVLLRLAGEQLAGRLTIAPRKIISVAEVLEPQDAMTISSVFRQRVHQIYECTEGFLASTCDHGTLHLNEDLVYFEREFLDRERSRFVPIITDLYRRTQPHVRYRLDDVLVLRREPCPCGSVLTAIEAIEGRCDDILYFRRRGSADQVVAVYADFIRRAILLGSDQVVEYQAVQKSIDDLAIGLKGRGGEASHAGVERELCRLAETMGFELPRLHRIPYAAGEATSKRRRVQRLFKIEGTSPIGVPVRDFGKEPGFK